MTARVLAILATLAILVTLASGCVRSESVRCGDEICPRGTTRCIAVSEVFTACASGDQVEACGGKQEAEPCELPGQPVGYCHGGACLPPACGDGVVDAPSELCDIASVVPPAQCSADCRTDLRCGNGVLDSGEVCDDLNPFSHDGCAAQCIPESPQWTELKPGAPKLRAGHAMAFDGVRGTVLLFGGFAGSALGDTFEWDGQSWLELATPSAPQPRSGHAMAFDAARGRVVLFGGRVEGASFESNDTWEWDGTRWRLIYTPAAPPRRTQHAMAYDAGRQRVILYGGVARKGPGLVALGDTWEWNGITWTEVVGTGPPARARHAMAYDAAAGVTIAFGGTSDLTDVLDETWELDGTSWTQRTPDKAPPPQVGAAMAFDGTRIVLVGGTDRDGGNVNQIWLWDGQTWTADRIPGVRNPAAAFDPRRDRVVVVGETIGIVAIHATIEWDPTERTLAAGSTAILRPLDGSAGTSATRSGRSWLFGGCMARTGPSCSEASQRTHVQVGNGWKALSDGPAMSPRTHAAIAYDEVRERLVMFGGHDGAVRGDTWIAAVSADLVSWELYQGAGPPARHMHTLNYDEARDEVVLFGGNGSGTQATPLQDTWIWNGAWEQRLPAQAPPARLGHASGYDLERERVVVFGGTTDDLDALLGDTWEWDGVSWTPIDAPGPPPRRHGRMAWDPVRRRLVLVGGEGTAGIRYNDVWEWDGTTWTELFPPVSPSAHGHHVLLTATDGAGVVMHGGRDGSGVIGETWRLRWEAAGSRDDRCRDDSDNDGDGLVGCADSDCWMACTPYCPPGLSCDPDAAPRCGDDVPQPWETCGICPADFGGPCPAVCGDFVCEPPEGVASCPGDCTP